MTPGFHSCDWVNGDAIKQDRRTETRVSFSDLCVCVYMCVQ